MVKVQVPERYHFIDIHPKFPRKTSMAAHQRILKNFIFYIITFSLAVAFCFALLEYGFARFYYSNVYEISDKVFDPVLGWRLKPGTYWVKPPHAFRKHSVYINKLGLRNRDIPSVKERGTKRILILGDSFTFGKVIPNQHIFSSQIENELDELFPKKFEIINAGVPGYGNAQELLFMRELANEGIVADVYLLVLFTNDILDNLRLGYGDLTEISAKPGFRLDRTGEIELKYSPRRSTSDDSENFVPVGEAPKRTKIVKILQRRIESFLQTRPALVGFFNDLGVDIKFPRMPGLLNAWYRDDILKNGIPLTKGIIKEIQHEADRRGAKLLVTLIPSPIQVYADVYGPLLKKTFPNNKLVSAWLKDNTRPQRIFRQKCEELNVTFLDLYPIMHQKNSQELFIPREGHLNKHGHTVVAHSLANFIVRNVE